jgi:hypothetical protein
LELFRLFGTVLIEDKDAIDSLKKVDDKGESTKTNLQNIADTGAKIGAAVVVGTGVAIGGLMAMANSTSESAAKWLELSQRTGIGIESLQRWGYAAGQSGADIDKLETGMKKLSQSMVDAQNGSDKAKSAYEQLGISMSDLATMTPEQAFDTVMNKLADMPESANKNVIGNQLLGKSYTELKTLLSEGSDGMQSLKDNADALGIVMSGESVVAAEGFGDTLDNVKLTFDGVKNKIMVELMPQLSGMLDWFLSKAPQIQSVAGAALGFISDTIGFIADHSNILIPILGGLAAAFVAMQIVGIVNGLMAAYTAFTTTATGVQIGLNAAMMANPIGLIIAAIAALVAIGVALVMNWDKIKEAAGKVGSWIGEKWDGIKSKTSEIWNGVKDTVKNVMEAAKENVKEKLSSMKKAYDENGGGIKGSVAAAWEGIKGFYNDGFNAVDKLTGGKLTAIKDAFTEKMNAAKDAVSSALEKAKEIVSNILEAIKNGVSDKVNAVKTSITNVFDKVKDIMSKPFEAAKEVIGGVIDKIKGFLNFNWEFPKLKLPHFSFSGSMNPLKWADEGIPKISVDWYAKGGIFSKPTIFNTPYGLKGVGDASSPEVVAPLSNLSEILREEIMNAIAPLYVQDKEPVIMVEVPLYRGEEELARGVYRGMKSIDNRYNSTILFN